MTYNPWMQQPPMPSPYAQPRPVAQPQPQRQQAMQPAPRPAAPVFRPVHVPPPEQLGITLADPPVEVPPPEKLGIRLD